MDTRIRNVELVDARAVQEIYAPFVSDSAISFEMVVPDVAEIQRRIQAQCERYPWLVFEAGGAVVGYTYASSHRTRHAYQWSVDVSVYIDRRFQRRGIGRALYVALFDLLRRQRYVNVYAGITLPNPSSIGLHESLGFAWIGVYRRVGFKFDHWHDVAWLHLALTDHPEVPPIPLLTEHLRRDVTVAAMFRQQAAAVRLG